MELAHTAAATLVVDHLSKVLGAPSLPKSAIAQAVIPFYGVNWNRKIITSITTNRTNYEMGRRRRSVLPLKEYERLVDFLLQAYLAHGLFPPGMEEWKLLADRFRLATSHEWEEIAALMPFSQARGISTPLQVSDIPPDGLDALFGACPSPLLIRSFWRIARATFAQPAAPTFSLPGHKSFAGKQRVSAIKRHSKQASLDRKLTAHLSPQLKKVRNFDKMGQAQRIRKLPEAKLDPRTLGKFVFCSTQANLIKQARGSLPAIASAFR